MAWQLENDRPIYTQIVEKIKLRIISGYFKPGERLPSVRELAAEAGVNPNTMQRAFVELERGGLVQTYRTSGRMVTQDADSIGRIRLEIATEMTDQFLRQMEELGFSREETAALFEKIREEGK